MKGNNGKRRNGMSWLSVLLIVAMLTPMFSAIALAEEYEVEAPAFEVEYELAYEEPLQETEMELQEYDEPEVYDEPEPEKVQQPEEVQEPEEIQEEAPADNAEAETEEQQDNAEVLADVFEAEERIVGAAVNIFDFDALNQTYYEYVSKPKQDDFIKTLPKTATAVLSDGSKVTVAIKWSCEDEYLFQTQDNGEFKFRAALTEDAEYELDNDEIAPEVTLYVVYISDVKIEGSSSYYTEAKPATADMAASELNFPTAVKATLKRFGDVEEPLTLPVDWVCDNYGDDQGIIFTAQFNPTPRMQLLDEEEMPLLLADDVEMPEITLDVVSDFEVEIKNGIVIITGWNGDSDTLHVPESIAGYPVEEIGEGAFKDRNELMDVVLPESVKKIGANAFANCSNLTFITIPDSLTDVAGSAFDGASDDLSITLEVNGSATTLSSQNQFKHDGNTVTLPRKIGSLVVKGDLTMAADFTVDNGNNYNRIEVKSGGKVTLNEGYEILNKSDIIIEGSDSFVNNGKVYGCYTGKPVSGIDNYITDHTDPDKTGICQICGQTSGKGEKGEKKLSVEITNEGKKNLTKEYNGSEVSDLTTEDFALDMSTVDDADAGKITAFELVSATFDSTEVGDRTVTAKFKITQADDCIYNYIVPDFTTKGSIVQAVLGTVAEIKDIPDQQYIDKAVEPAVTVKLKNGRILKKDTDYTVSYANNTEAGTATATVTGKGSYTGTLTKNFNITQAKKLTLTYTGEEKPFKTYDGKNDITLNKESFALTGMAEGESVKIDSLEGKLDSVAVGDNHTVTVTAKLNPSNNVAECTITGVSVKARNISDQVSLAAIAEQKQTGAEVKPGVKLIFNGKDLVEGRDYTLKYENNIEPGTAKVTITGTGNFAGTRETAFQIVEVKDSDKKTKKLTATLIDDSKKNKVYDGTTKSSLTASDFMLETGDIADEDVGHVKIASVNAYYDDKDAGERQLMVFFTLEQASATYNYVVDSKRYDDAEIEKRTITVIPLPGQYKIYGTREPTYFNAYENGLVDGDYITGLMSREEGEDRGTYGYSAGTLDAGDNYEIMMAGDQEEDASDEEDEDEDTGAAQFTVRPKNLASADITVKFDAEVYRTRDEKAVEPDITVTYHAYDGDKELEEGTDYEVKFTDNTKRGTGHAIITAVNSEECNYTGTRVADFRIKKEHSGGSGSSSSSSYEEEDDEDDDGDDDGEDDQDTIKDGQLVLGDDENRIDIGFILCGDDNKARPFKNRDYPDIEDIEETDPETGETTAPVAFDADGNPILPKRLTIEPEPFPASYDENNEIIPRQMDSNPERDKYEALHLRLNQEQVNKLKAEHITELVFKVEERAEFRVPLDALTFEVDVDRLNKTDTDEESSEETEEEWGEGDASSDEEDSEESEGEIEEYDGEPEGDGLEDESDSEDGATITPNLVPVYTYEMVIEQLEDVNLTAREENAFEDKFSMLPLYRVKMSAVDNELVIYPNDSEVQPSTIEAENTYYPMLGYLENVEYRIDEYLLKTPGDGEVDTLPKSAQMLYVSSDENLSDEDAIVLGEAEYVVTGDEPYALFSNGKDGLYTIVVDKDWTEEDEESEDEEYEDTEDEEFEDEDIEESSEEAEEAELEDEPEEVEPVVEEEPEEQLVEDPDPVYAYSRKSNAGDQYWLIDTQNKTVEYYRGDTNTYMIGDYSGSLMSGMAVTFRTNPPETTTIQLKFKQTYKFAMMDDAGVSLLMEQDDIGAVQSTMSSHRQ